MCSSRPTVCRRASSIASTTSRRRSLPLIGPVLHLQPKPPRTQCSMRHESASNAADESTEECWSLGPEEVHSRQPCGRPDAKPDCKEQGYRNGMSHVDTPGGARSSARVLHLHPAQASPALVAAVDALRDDPFESEGADIASPSWPSR